MFSCGDGRWTVFRGLLLGSLVGLWVLSACGGRGVAVQGVGDGARAYYQTGYPERDLSREIEEAFRSIHRLAYTGQYLTHVFAADAGVVEGDLYSMGPTDPAVGLDPAVLGRAAERFTETHSQAGTVVVVARSGRGALLVTNDHVARFPPVLVQYFDPDRAGGGRPGDAPGSRRVASVSVLVREQGILVRHTAMGPLEVLVRDSARDLALLEARFPRGASQDDFPSLPAPAGDPGRLSWGSMVFALGYPGGYPMVTRAIVSDPDRDGRGGFLTDGLWNEGISGGAILAVRSRDGALEWIGLARAGAGSREVRLQPEDRDPPEDGASVVYDGRIYAESTLRLQYGITMAVPVTALGELLREQAPLLRRRGYRPVRF